TRLEFRDGFGYREDDVEAMKAANFHLDREESRGVFVICHKERRPFLVNDIDEISNELSPRSLEFAKKMGSKSFICCPIIFENESLGVVAVDNIRTKRPLIQSDINLLMGIVPEIGISIHNAFLVEERDSQFRSILQTLAASIDARDFLTAGHSERVTRYALGICREMGLSREYTEMIRVASQLHDYGKIGIQDSILKKAGPLSVSEKEEIKTHAAKTESILKRINFEGIYQEVPFIAGSHHEKMDGSGYPRGLKGEEIPLGSRIIAVADFFEAITAKRHYRDPMTYEEAIDALMAETGTHFDPEVVHAFVAFIAGEADTREALPI
ncbi:MAG: GAF and HD-GYP domain-containing protein, partial [Clostridia bacterium]